MKNLVALLCLISALVGSASKIYCQCRFPDLRNMLTSSPVVVLEGCRSCYSPTLTELKLKKTNLNMAFSHQCKSCYAKGSTCEDTVIECPTKKCMTVSMWILHLGKLEKTMQRGCESFMLCGIKNSQESPYGMSKTSYVCCEGKECNIHPYAFEYLKPHENDLMEIYTPIPVRHCGARHHR